MDQHHDPHGGRGQQVNVDRPLAGGESDHDLWGELLEEEPEPASEEERATERE